MKFSLATNWKLSFTMPLIFTWSGTLTIMTLCWVCYLSRGPCQVHHSIQSGQGQTICLLFRPLGPCQMLFVPALRGNLTQLGWHFLLLSVFHLCSCSYQSTKWQEPLTVLLSGFLVGNLNLFITCIGYHWNQSNYFLTSLATRYTGCCQVIINLIVHLWFLTKKETMAWGTSTFISFNDMRGTKCFYLFCL